MLNGNSIGIGETCVGIGALISIVFFLLPLAYMYKGKIGSKLYWLLSGFLLLLVLNVLRMFFVALAWFIYGPNNAILTIHFFAGIILFYISIIVMVLLSGKYGLTIPLSKATQKLKKQKTYSPGLYQCGLIAAMVIAAISYLLTTNYVNATLISPVTVTTVASLNTSSSILNPMINNITNTKGYASVVTKNSQGTLTTIGMTNRSNNNTTPLIIAFTSSKLNLNSVLVNKSAVLGSLTFLDNKSAVENVYYEYSKGTYFFVYHKLIPITLSNGSTAGITMAI